MRNWFEWSGERCTNYGIVVTELPPITIPKERVETAEIPGRAGSLTIVEGESVYENIELTAKCYVKNGVDVAVIADWLRGSGTLTFANRPGGYYRARVREEISFEKILRGSEALSFEITFDCMPFFYALDAPDVVITSVGATIIGQGGIFAEPLISVTGSGTVWLFVNDTQVTFSDLDGTIYIDSEAGMAYTVESGSIVFAGSHVVLEDDVWPVLKAKGARNIVSVRGISGGTYSSVVIRPRWREL